jgi:Domain of unknown function (DUF4276)
VVKPARPLSVQVYVEGGGPTRGGDLAGECRRGFSVLFERATGRKVGITACGGRNQAYDLFEAPAHLMVVCMEAWLLADPEALGKHFGKDFDASKLTKWTALWQVPKDALDRALHDATKDRDRRKGGPYDEGRDSFKILAHVRHEKLETCPYAKALFDELRHRLGRAAVDNA